jgi:hypothetical protein
VGATVVAVARTPIIAVAHLGAITVAILVLVVVLLAIAVALFVTIAIAWTAVVRAIFAIHRPAIAAPHVAHRQIATVVATIDALEAVAVVVHLLCVRQRRRGGHENGHKGQGLQHQRVLCQGVRRHTARRLKREPSRFVACDATCRCGNYFPPVC